MSPAARYPRGREGLVVHRARRFPPVVRLAGLITVTSVAAVTTSWPLLAGPDRRAPAIDAVRQRIVTAQELQASVGLLPRLIGRGELLALCDLLEAGCESELEIWGHLHVFDTPGPGHAARQRVVHVAGRSYRLDLAYEHERVAVELDGWRFHSGREHRERDMRRDAALATLGWLTLRFSHERLHDDPRGCRRDTLACLAARR